MLAVNFSSCPHRLRKEIHALQVKVEALSAAPQSKQAKLAANDANVKAEVREN